MNRILDQIFGPIPNNVALKRIGGGYQTDVYGSDNHHYVVKLKTGHGAPLSTVLAHAHEQRNVAYEFIECLGPEHTIANDYVITGTREAAYVLVIQPFIDNAQPLSKVRYAMLTRDRRTTIAKHLLKIMQLALVFYRRTGYMPDLYGLPMTNDADRRRLRAPHLVPMNVWNLLTRQTLLRSNNLLLSREDPVRIVLVDYDLVHPRRWVRRVHYAVRALFFLRDRWLIRRVLRQDAEHINVEQ